MACSGSCKSCDKCVDTCGCNKNRLTYAASSCCADKIPAECVIYGYGDTQPTSKLMCFLGVSNNTPLNIILERLDKSLCLLNTFNPQTCARNLLGLPAVSDIHTVVQKLLDYACNSQDEKVKISATDTSSGYLAEKILLGDCMLKSIVQDSFGKQVLKIELDYNCIKNKLPSCIEVNCVDCNTTSCSQPVFGTPNIICQGSNTLVTVTVVSPVGSLIQFSSNEGVTWVDGNPNSHTFTFPSNGTLQKIKARMAGCTIYTDGFVQLCSAPPVAPVACTGLTSCTFNH